MLCSLHKSAVFIPTRVVSKCQRFVPLFHPEPYHLHLSFPFEDRKAAPTTGATLAVKRAFLQRSGRRLSTSRTGGGWNEQTSNAETDRVKATPKTKLGLPDLDHSKAAVLDSLRSPESKR